MYRICIRCIRYVCDILFDNKTFLEKSGKHNRDEEREGECPNRATARVELFNRRFVPTRYLQIISRYIVSG